MLILLVAVMVRSFPEVRVVPFMVMVLSEDRVRLVPASMVAR